MPRGSADWPARQEIDPDPATGASSIEAEMPPGPLGTPVERTRSGLSAGQVTRRKTSGR